MPDRPIMYVDPNTRNIRRVSFQISALSRFEPNTERFTEGMLKLLNELKRNNNSNNNKVTLQSVVQLNNVRSFIKDMKIGFYECEEKMDSISRYSHIKAVVDARIKEQRLIIVG